MALYFPQFDEAPVTSPAHQPKSESIMDELALIAGRVSSSINIHSSHSLVFEIRSSVSYFNGVHNILREVREPCAEVLNNHGLDPVLFHGASPTPSASLLLARAGADLIVESKQNLRSVLGRLPVSILPVNREQKKKMKNSGLRKLRDLWRLPQADLMIRLGPAFVNHLQRCLGDYPEPLLLWQRRPRFSSLYELPYEVSNVDRLLPVVNELVSRLCVFLQKRELCSSQMLFSFLHEKQVATVIELILRQGSRSEEHLMMLLETRLADRPFCAPVTAVKLEVEQFDAFISHSDNLLEKVASLAGYGDTSFTHLIEQLQARLGQNAIKSVGALEDYCPEMASYYYSDNKTASVPDSVIKRDRWLAAIRTPRPMWLLPRPSLLVQRQNKLYGRTELQLLSGPERIESRWWAGRDVRRDYYIARDRQGARLWIFRERTGVGRWFLHGMFS